MFYGLIALTVLRIWKEKELTSRDVSSAYLSTSALVYGFLCVA